MKWTPIDPDVARSIVGEGVHTGLRKGTDAEDAHELWKAISDSETTAWSDAIGFFVWGLGQMGMAICKKEVEEP